MFAKRSSRALALLLALPSAAFALGLGDIHLLSALNAPLDLVLMRVKLVAHEGAYGLDDQALLIGQLEVHRPHPPGARMTRPT